jgi:uncharacterized Zn-binding protein involved in type VI secretion
VVNGQVELTSATEGTALAGSTEIATFFDSNTSDTASDFIAIINWGDGTTTTGTVGGGGRVTFGSGPLQVQGLAFTVFGAHAYNDEGSFPLSVGIIRTTDNVSGTLNGTVTTAEADALTAQPVTIIPDPNTLSFSGVVANFTDTNISNVVGDFTATINWGDTTTTTGTVSGSNGAFTCRARTATRRRDKITSR